MQAVRAFRPALFVAPLCLALTPVGDDVTFHPKDGAEVTKTFVNSMELGLDDLSMTVDGNDMSEMMPLDQAHMTVTSTMTITDKYVKVAEGRPTELIRSFDSIESSVEAGPETTSNEDLEKLEGKKVSFKWNEDNKAYDVAYHETEGDADMLERLAEDMDLRALLPDRNVKEGDKWEIDADGLMTVIFAGMRLDKMDMGDAPEEMADVIEEMMSEIKRLGNDVKTVCEYKGARDVDGKQCGAIAIKVEGKPSLDLSGLITTIMQKQGEASGTTLDVDVKKATLGLEINAAGELVWNLGDGHVATFQLAPNVQITADIDFSVDAAGEAHTVQASVEASAKSEMNVSTK
ncbi:MAG: hypothetical protein HZA52_19535 [Planctomycetes bacterium]|nr:hypothetical protein [Planctomycetota bacterium]